MYAYLFGSAQSLSRRHDAPADGMATIVHAGASAWHRGGVRLRIVGWGVCAIREARWGTRRKEGAQDGQYGVSTKNG